MDWFCHASADTGFDTQKAFSRKSFQAFTQSSPRHAESIKKLRFQRQFLTRRQTPSQDVLRKRADDLFVR